MDSSPTYEQIKEIIKLTERHPDTRSTGLSRGHVIDYVEWHKLGGNYGTYSTHLHHPELLPDFYGCLGDEFDKLRWS